jgi:hypothetical protein
MITAGFFFLFPRKGRIVEWFILKLSLISRKGRLHEMRK